MTCGRCFNKCSSEGRRPEHENYSCDCVSPAFALPTFMSVEVDVTNISTTAIVQKFTDTSLGCLSCIEAQQVTGCNPCPNYEGTYLMEYDTAYPAGFCLRTYDAGTDSSFQLGSCRGNMHFWTYFQFLSETAHEACGDGTCRPQILVELGINYDKAANLGGGMTSLPCNYTYTPNDFIPNPAVCFYPDTIQLLVAYLDMAYTCDPAVVSYQILDIAHVYTFPPFRQFNWNGPNVFKKQSGWDCLCQFPDTLTVTPVYA